MFRPLIDFIYRSINILCLASIALLLASIAGLILIESLNFFNAVGPVRIFADSSWFPDESGGGSFGAFPMLTTSLLLAVASTAISAPLALAITIYQRYYASYYPALLVRRTIEAMGAVPSVVFGLVGLTVLVPMIQMIQAPGSSFIAGVLIVSLMIVPTAALVYDAGFERFDRALFLNCAALGITKGKLVFSILLPSLLPTIGSGAILALARAIGETMAVLMVTGNVIQHPTSMFAPVRTLTANIALEMPYAMGIHRSSLFACGLLVVAITVAIAVTAKVLLKRWD